MRSMMLSWLATLLAVFTYFYGLDSQHIPKNGDEYPYAHITRLTAGSGHLLPLQSQLDHMRDTKPPLAAWAVAGIFDATRDTAFVREVLPALAAEQGAALAVLDLLSVIAAQTQSVCREVELLHDFPDRAVIIFIVPTVSGLALWVRMAIARALPADSIVPGINVTVDFLHLPPFP